MMELPQPQSKSFPSLLTSIESGQTKIPKFQRDFVWDKKKSSELMDSIIKGYPIGTLIIWKTKERLRDIKNMGDQEFPSPSKGDYVEYVLDGQQRLTSIYASLKGITITRDNGKLDDYSEIYVDLQSEDDDIVTIDIERKDPKYLIKLTDLVFGDIRKLNEYPEELHNILLKYRERITTYSFSVVEVKNAPMDIATEIFTRINIAGKPLSLFEIMVAKTYDPHRNFDLEEKYNIFIENLRHIDYDTIDNVIILQTISLLLKGEISRKTILNLERDSFIDLWEPATEAIERAADFFKSTYRIPVSEILPFKALVISFAYFFYHHPTKPNALKQKYLEDFFWRCAIGERYSSSADNKLIQDIKKIDKILNDELPNYDWQVDTRPESIIDNGSFGTGRSYIKSILCLYAYHEPKSFNDDSIVHIDNQWLKRANSKNYHHFFPKAYLKARKINDFKSNHILNITIVDEFLNKNQIRTKAPSVYMKKFLDEIGVPRTKLKKNILNKRMKTHLIPDLNKMGVWDDDFDKFFNKRAEIVSKELENRIIRENVTQSIDIME